MTYVSPDLRPAPATVAERRYLDALLAVRRAEEALDAARAELRYAEEMFLLTAER